MMKNSRKPKYFLVLTSCKDGCCTSQYSREAKIKSIQTLNTEKDLSIQLMKIFESWLDISDEDVIENFEGKFDQLFHGYKNGGEFRQSSQCGCFEKVIIRKISDLPSFDEIKIN